MTIEGDLIRGRYDMDHGRWATLAIRMSRRRSRYRAKKRIRARCNEDGSVSREESIAEETTMCVSFKS